MTFELADLGIDDAREHNNSGAGETSLKLPDWLVGHLSKRDAAHQQALRGLMLYIDGQGPSDRLGPEGRFAAGVVIGAAQEHQGLLEAIHNNQ